MQEFVADFGKLGLLLHAPVAAPPKEEPKQVQTSLF